MTLEDAIGRKCCTPEILRAHQYALEQGWTLRSAGLGGGISLDYGDVSAQCAWQPDGHYSIHFREGPDSRWGRRQAALAFACGEYVDTPVIPRHPWIYWSSRHSQVIVRVEGAYRVFCPSSEPR